MGKSEGGSNKINGLDYNIIKNKEKFVLNYERGRFVNFTKYSDIKVKQLARKVILVETKKELSNIYDNSLQKNHDNVSCSSLS